MGLPKATSQVYVEKELQLRSHMVGPLGHGESVISLCQDLRLHIIGSSLAGMKFSSIQNQEYKKCHCFSLLQINLILSLNPQG